MSFQESLLSELSRRQARNASYSLRSFASHLGLSPALLSQLLSGARPLTHRTAVLLSQRLSLDPEQSTKLLMEVNQRRKGNPASPPAGAPLSIDAFKIISDWEHYAVLALADVPNNQAAPAWIAKRLNIPSSRAQEVWTRLEKLGYVKKKGKGFAQAVPSLSTTQDIPSAAIQKFHRQHLEKAASALTNTPVDQRYFGALTFALDPSDLPKFKKLLRQSRGRLAQHASKGKRKLAYHFAMQLFPIDQGEEK